jgi:hypothetical protein
MESWQILLSAFAQQISDTNRNLVDNLLHAVLKQEAIAIHPVVLEGVKEADPRIKLNIDDDLQEGISSPD